MIHHDQPAGTTEHPRVRSQRLLWLSWLVGACALAGVIAVALHFSEVEDVVQVMQKMQPG